MVPGNHDWYATEVDSQAAHVDAYASERAVAIRFEPYEQGQPPLPESEDFPGVSLVFLDSEWLLRANDSQRDAATAKSGTSQQGDRVNGRAIGRMGHKPHQSGPNHNRREDD